MAKPKINSKAKGKRGELEAVHLLRRLGFLDARRGQQFQGSPDSPDIVNGIPGAHIEVKNRQQLNVYGAMAQANRDKSPGDIAVAMVKKNRERWLFVIEAADAIRFAGCLARGLQRPIYPGETGFRSEGDG